MCLTIAPFCISDPPTTQPTTHTSTSNTHLCGRLLVGARAVQQETKHVVDEDGARVGALTQRSAAGLQKSKITDSNPHLEKNERKNTQEW